MDLLPNVQCLNQTHTRTHARMHTRTHARTHFKFEFLIQLISLVHHTKHFKEGYIVPCKPVYMLHVTHLSALSCHYIL